MPLQTSGPISLSNVGSEFQNSAPYSMSEFYGAAAGIPASGAIGLSNFYGATAAKVETIIIPASETGWHFAGDIKNYGPEHFKNIGASPYTATGSTPQTWSLMYTKYSRFAEQLGYSSILVQMIPAHTAVYAAQTVSVAQIFMTNLPVNTSVDSATIYGLDMFGKPRPYEVAGKNHVKNIKSTKLGVTAQLNYCNFDTKIAGSVPAFIDIGGGTTIADEPVFKTIGGDLAFPYDPNSNDFPIDWFTGPQQYSIEIEWV